MILKKEEAYHKLALLCSRKEYCISEIRNKMQYWHLSQTDQNAIVNQLIEEKYIDETRYTEAYVRDKFIFNKWGKYKIRFQLKQKQVNPNLIEDALEQISDEDYTETIQALIQSKIRQVKAKNDYERKNKLLRFLVQRGFEMEPSNKVLDTLGL
jgi:regulatory protein